MKTLYCCMHERLLEPHDGSGQGRTALRPAALPFFTTRLTFSDTFNWLAIVVSNRRPVCDNHQDGRTSIAPTMKVLVMSSNAPVAPETSLQIPTFDGPLGRRIIETHIWAVREGLNGSSAHDLFDGYCQRLVIHGVPLWRAHASARTDDDDSTSAD